MKSGIICINNMLNNIKIRENIWTINIEKYYEVKDDKNEKNKELFKKICRVGTT